MFPGPLCTRLGLWGVCHERDVRTNEAASHSISERGADDDVDVVEGLGREFTAGAAATGDEVVVQAIDVFDA